MAAARANPSSVLVGVSALLVGVGIGVWVWQMQTLDQAIAKKRGGLKSFYIGERLPPNRQVTDYFTDRLHAIETQYRIALSLITMNPTVSTDEVRPNPQLFFQERVHEVSRTLERLAAARGIPPATQLGLPKELPPAEAVPRFLIQIGLIEELAEMLMTVPGVLQIESFKIEDPQGVEPLGDEQDSFLTRLSVRVRLGCTLEAIPLVLNVIDRARPLVDLQSLVVTPSRPEAKLDVKSDTKAEAKPETKTEPVSVSGAAATAKAKLDALDVELVVAHYLFTPPRESTEQPRESERATRPQKSAPRQGKKPSLPPS